MTNEAEVFAQRQARRRHQEWVERQEQCRCETMEIEYPVATDTDGYEVTPATGVVL